MNDLYKFVVPFSKLEMFGELGRGRFPFLSFFSPRDYFISHNYTQNRFCFRIRHKTAKIQNFLNILSGFFFVVFFSHQTNRFLRKGNESKVQRFWGGSKTDVDVRYQRSEFGRSAKEGRTAKLSRFSSWSLDYEVIFTFNFSNFLIFLLHIFFNVWAGSNIVFLLSCSTFLLFSSTSFTYLVTKFKTNADFSAHYSSSALFWHAIYLVPYHTHIL